MTRHRWRPSNFKAPVIPLRVANALGSDGGTASLYLYDAIDAWADEWGGVSAAQFVAALNDIQASRIDLHLNSPGGDYREAVAMRAALVAHPAAIYVFVDGLAASAASILATVGERVVMAPGSQQMIHKASVFAIGNADDLRAEAEFLDSVDTMIAGFYAQRAGSGSVEDWLALMSAETWYSPEEAIAAGLADEVADFGGPAREQPEQVAAAAPDRWIVAAWKYAGRDNAPAPGGDGGETGGNLPDGSAVTAVVPAAVVSNDEQPPANQAAPEQTPDAPAPDAPPAETALPTAPTVNLSELLCSAIREGVTL